MHYLFPFFIIFDWYVRCKCEELHPIFNPLLPILYFTQPQFHSTNLYYVIIQVEIYVLMMLYNFFYRVSMKLKLHRR